MWHRKTVSFILGNKLYLILMLQIETEALNENYCILDNKKCYEN
jgi:hypothetical protein